MAGVNHDPWDDLVVAPRTPDPEADELTRQYIAEFRRTHDMRRISADIRRLVEERSSDGEATERREAS